MSILATIPFSLPLQQAYQDMGTILFDNRVFATIQDTGYYDDVIAATSYGDVTNGKGIINTYQVDMSAIETRKYLSNTSTPTPWDDLNPYGDYRLKVKQEAILLDTYEVSAVTTNQVGWTNESFESGESMNKFLQFMGDMPMKSLKVDLYENKLDPLFGVWAHNNTITDWDNSTPTTNAEKNQQDRRNATALANYINLRSRLYQRKQTNFTDTAGVITMYSKTDMRLYIREELRVWIDLALSGVFNQENIRNTFNVDDIVVIPAQSTKLDVTKPALWLCHKNKVSHIKGYNTSLSNLNGRAGYLNTFYHRGIGWGVFPKLAGESIMLGTTTKQAPATSQAYKKASERVKNLGEVDDDTAIGVN